MYIYIYICIHYIYSIYSVYVMFIFFDIKLDSLICVLHLGDSVSNKRTSTPGPGSQHEDHLVQGLNMRTTWSGVSS